MKKMERVSWYQNWFDSPYYDILYQNRDELEAQQFIGQLASSLQIAQGANILDLACGKGRHAKSLAQEGFLVTGVDLSSRNIEFAKAFEYPNLHFFQGDIREPLQTETFDYIFNLFTSFGYFETYQEHVEVLQNVRSMLKEEGVFVLDYFNAKSIQKALPTQLTVKRAGIRFHIKKQQQHNRVLKRISFRALGKRHFFEENVCLFTLANFQDLFARAGLSIKATYGDYHLNPYDENASPRLILVATNKSNIN